MILKISSLKISREIEDLKKELEKSLKYENDKENVKIYLEFDENSKDNTLFNYALVKDYIDKINGLYPNNNFEITVQYRMNTEYILDTDKCKELEKIDNYLREKNYDELYISEKNASFGMYGFRQTLSANRKLDSLANNIKNASNNGEPLSNFEKFMLAYECVTNYFYNEGGDLLHSSTSHWVPVIEGDKIVCAGYASLLSALCDRIFSPSEVKVLQQDLEVYDKNYNKNIGGHGNNIIFIKDEKYGIDGLFYVDACWDSINDTRKDKPQAYCCIPLQDILYNKNYSFDFGDMSVGLTHFYLSQDKEYSDFVEKRELEKYEKRKDGEFFVESEMPYEKKTIEDEIEKYLLGYNSQKKDVQFYKNYISNVVQYEIEGAKPKSFYDELSKFEKVAEEKVTKDFKDIFEQYKDVEISNYLPSTLIEYYKLQPHIDNLSSGEYDISKLKESIIAVAKAFSDSKAKGFMENWKNEGLGTQSLKDFAQLYIVSELENKKRKQMEEELENKAKEGKTQNARNLIKSINEKANSNSVPFEAFVKSYKIIGKMKGLEGEELKQYVKNRIIKSVERTNNCFEVENCNSCFAKTRVEDIERGVIKIK